MGNLLDYLDWRGDVPFRLDPFNEADNLILAVLAYTELEGVLPGDGFRNGMGIRALCEAYLSSHPEEESQKAGGVFAHLAPPLLKKLAASERFGGLVISDYINLVSKDHAEQMAAVTCQVGDGSVYVAFRGTDNSLVGWKEDFLLAYTPQTSGQKHAAEYLSRIGSCSNMPLRVGGHSKGGNLAVYAAAFCAPEIRPRVVEVYSNDGPGFLPEVVGTPEYAAVCPKVRGFIPEETLFGLLLENRFAQKVIRSSRKGIMQHDAFSWEILRNRFTEAAGVSGSSRYLDRTITAWINELSPQSRREFVDTVFDVLETPGSATFAELNQSKLKNYGEMVKAVLELDKDSAAVTGQVETGDIMVDGLGVGDVGNIVLRDRQHLSEDGIIIVVMTLEKGSNQVLSGPDIVSRGFVYVRESEDLMDEARLVVEEAYERCVQSGVTDWGKIKSTIKEALGGFVWKRTQRRPMLLPIIMEA